MKSLLPAPLALLFLASPQPAFAAGDAGGNPVTSSLSVPDSSPDNARNIVSRYEGVWTAPPRKVPVNSDSDAPLLGNGDIGVLVGGAPEKQQFYLSKCDFWRPQPYFPWFSPALVGGLDLEIPALKGAAYKAVQDIAKAEVRQTFTRPEGTVELRSWTPATGHELIVEISCTGKPVEIKALPWTYFGNGATVTAGRDGDVSWLTRSFSGPGYDWESHATLAMTLEGSGPGAATSDQGVSVPVPSEKSPILLGGRQLVNKEKQQYTKPFEGQFHALDLYDHVLSEEEIAKLQQGGAIGSKPLYSTRQSNADGIGMSKENIEGLPAGEAALAPKSFTLVLDVTPSVASGKILQIGEPGKGVVISQIQRRAGYHLQVRAGHSTVGSFENLVPNERIVAVITSDTQSLLLHLKGNVTGARRIDGTPRTLTLQPGKSVRLVAAVRTNQEKPDFQALAIKEAGPLGDDVVARLLKEHRAWWSDFWNESSTEISDPVLEGYYYGSFYIMACCSRNKEFAPALFGNWASADIPAMGGDYHLNYNHQGPWWGCYAANHIGLTDPYDAPVLQYLERGKYMAKTYLGRKGVYYCVGIGPKGSCTCWDNHHDGWKDDVPANHFFGGQKCDALFGGINMAMRWNATLDPDYARKVYPFMSELAAFWVDDLVWENGRYSIVRDNIFEGGDPGRDKNNPMSLSFLRSCLKATLEMSRTLGVDADKREKWQHILDHLSGYAVFERNGKKVFRYSEEGTDFDTRGVACGLMHLYPADAVGLESSPDLLEISRNSIEQHPKAWKGGNTTMSFYPGMARAGYDPEAILKGLSDLIKEAGYPNFVIDRYGGGIETCSTVTATINEMLLQSHQGVIRIFADWPANRDARFDNLRAHGAFLVSAEQKGGVVQNVRIVSERGTPCALRNPWQGKKIRLIRNGKPAEELSGDIVRFPTSAGDLFGMRPE